MKRIIIKETLGRDTNYCLNCLLFNFIPYHSRYLDNDDLIHGQATQNCSSQQFCTRTLLKPLVACHIFLSVIGNMRALACVNSQSFLPFVIFFRRAFVCVCRCEESKVFAFAMKKTRYLSVVKRTLKFHVTSVQLILNK